MDNPIIECACGCLETLLKFDNKGRVRSFIRGHYSRTDEYKNKIALLERPPRKRGEENWRADGKHWRTARWRARSITDTSKCAWVSIGGCKGNIDAAHINGDFTDQSKENRLALCRSHHKLLDNGKIDYNRPEMPSFYTDKRGHRRYYHSSRRGLLERRGIA